jgi:hypothetical protein
MGIEATLIMEPQDRPQDWRTFSLSHRMGEGRGEGLFRPYAAATLTTSMRTLQNHYSPEIDSTLLIANWEMRQSIREQTS